ncbi:MAG: RloB domain-containing protein [Alphaproteobacteria bacterium]|nr:RloB domain-containing protein [Alphaproteobacteria bacterium]
MNDRRRSAKSFDRGAPRREPYDHILIVCEGKKTEPSYFRGLIRALRLSSANIEITPANGSDPMSVVSFAENKNRADKYDKVYCVFDRNGHTNYDDALEKIAKSELGRAGKMQAITSWPCFEVWLLLHYRLSEAPIVATGSRSSCDMAINELKQYLPEYTKGHGTIYNGTAHNLNLAIFHADILEKRNKETNSKNPATSVHILVKHLLSIKESNPS